MSARLRPGDTVEVKTPGEILETLDADGTLDQLPFMPEMIAYCGKRFQVLKRALNTCVSGPNAGMRGFPQDDVLVLEGLRCSGADHDGCQKGCLIFWREAWLRKVRNPATPVAGDATATQRLRARLKTLVRPNVYFCQASEIMKVTQPLSRKERIPFIFREVLAGNCSPFEMARRIVVWLVWRIRCRIRPYAQGNKTRTPTESLKLQPGERVEIKSLDSVVDTLNTHARNRGLAFFPNMRLLCGSQQRVERRLDKLIVDETGEMRQMHNTVFLENSYCGCSYVAFGGCPRNEYAYWREIWLRRPVSRS